MKLHRLEAGLVTVRWSADEKRSRTRPIRKSGQATRLAPQPPSPSRGRHHEFEAGPPGIRVCDGIHLREYPLRDERSGGPSFKMPAYFLQGASLSFSLASVSSSDMRTSRPAGSPVMRDFSRNRSSSSSGRRIVSVLLI